MHWAAVNPPMRAFQVQIREEYLDNLYQFDAGSTEQEIFAMAEQGLVIVVTDRPETIFLKLGDAVKSVTYLGPMVDLPEEPVYANHVATARSPLEAEAEPGAFADGLWQGITAYLMRARDFTIRTGLLALMPVARFLGLALKKILPARALRALRLGGES